MFKSKAFYHFIFLLVLAGCSTGGQEGDSPTELTVSAAASLQDALKEIGEDFEKEHPDISIKYNFGGSGSLQQQISQGAPADIFFSAAEDKYERLVEEERIDEADGIHLLKNEIVLVLPKDSDQDIQTFTDLSKAARISIGTPESVPAGQYAKETLKQLNIWDEVEEKIIFAKDVRQVLTYVETGNVDAGIVYQTDAQSSSEVKVTAAADKDSHAPIIYPVGLIKDSSHKEQAQIFYEYLQSEQTMEIFENYGFKKAG
ncbi:molybdate ABC transporter substrate-binding protein [Halobacillus massiliensis]|uniref:molybdate ABC transporter substrate-binding protein n=1 Tax=Halobacillus massiliensis TaxID=1926286 RepID=UPI0009E35EDF|nr:molybdate ABC transporter substrate-binding protein [Halobacillus massiliensis]